MPEIIAVGAGSQRQCRVPLAEGQATLLGRAPRNGWAVPWDRLISREHARLSIDKGKLRVEVLETARNPVLWQGEPNADFCVAPGESFRIGETTFYLRDESETDPGDSVVAEHFFEDEILSSERFSDPSSCLHALCKMPEIIASAPTDGDLAAAVVELLLDSIRGSLAAAAMQYDGPPGAAIADPKLMRWNSRGNQVQRFRPSRRLLNSAMQRGQSVVHLWMDDTVVDDQFTMNNDLDWAFATPVVIGPGERWCFYASGQRRFTGMREVRSPQDLIAELRTAELIAKFFGSVRKVRALEQQHVEMRRFFSPAVVEEIAGTAEQDALEPRFGEVSVLFCDVRGFSRKVESSGDLHSLLRQVSKALSVMTRGILRYEGVIADFQGDAALGFWGWPSRQEDAAALACRAALAIHQAFADAETDARHPLRGYKVGIGVGLGEAITGRIGAAEQIKVGVFGPVVNLASRLQDLTKQVGVPILLDGPAAQAAGKTLGPSEGVLRRLGKFRPPGIENATQVYALLPSDPLTAEQKQRYEAAVTAMSAGDWDAALSLLDQLPSSDGPAAFLRRVLRDSGQAPADWDGALTIERAGAVRFRTGHTTKVARPTDG